jgi:hypothetical protein
VVDLLPGPEGLSESQAACVVRTAAIVGGEAALEKLTEFVTVDEAVVIEELLRAWRRSDDPEDYARSVLAHVDFGDRRLEVRGWHRAVCLRHLPSLTNVACYGDVTPLDPLAAIPNLRRLELIQNEVLRDLGPLARCRTLRVLRLRGCGWVRDLSPLARTTVEELALYLMRADLATLRGARLRSLSIRDPRIEAGLQVLPAELPLRELVVDNLPGSRSLLGVERWRELERLSIMGAPRPDELQALARLPGLRHLVVRRPAAAGELAPLEALLSLRRLDLDDVPVPEEDGLLAAVQRQLPEVEVRVNGRLAEAVGS